MSRARYVYRPNAKGEVEAIQVSGDYTGAERRAQTATEGITYGNSMAPDGTDISTRNKRKAYMKRTGAADPQDYTEHLRAKRAERDAFYTGKTSDPTRKDDIQRTIYQLRSQRRR